MTSKKNVQAVNRKIEALESQLKHVTAPKERINLMNELGWELNKTAPERTLSIAQEAYQLAAQYQYKKGMADSLRNLGSSAWKLNDYVTALEKLSAAKALFEELNEQEGLADTLLYTSTVHGVLGDYSSCLEYAFEGLEMANQVAYKWAAAQLLNNISLSYQLLAQYPESIKYFHKALNLAKEMDNFSEQAKVFNNLALSYMRFGQYEEALVHSLESLQLIQQDREQDKRLEAIILDTLGNIYSYLGDKEKSLFYLHKCLTLSRQLNYTFTEITALLNIGKVYKKENHDRSIEYLLNALTLANQHQTRKRQVEAHQLLTELYEAQGDHVQALHHHKQLYKVHQEIFNEESDRKIKNMEVLHRTEAARKETQIYREKNDELEQEISERKRVEAELVKANEVAEVAKEAAEVANRAKSDFLSNMSHELRTPLNAILGFSQLIMRHPGLDGELQDNVGIINRSGEHLLTLINNVLDLSKIESGHTTIDEKNFDLYRFLDDLEDMFHLKAEQKRLQLIFERMANVPQYVRSDETKMRQVLINLLNNAIKFTEEGGVSMRVGYKITDSGHSQLLFEVEDTGAGIAPDELESLFEAFVQTQTGKESQEGTGLGLPISRKFIELMGGDIKVRSQVGYGTIFIFEIQVEAVSEDEIASQPAKRRVIALEPNQPRYRILVVDDKEINRQLLLKLLLPFGFAVKEASHGKEAIDVWQAWKPDLIWMDMRMPVMDGYEATKRIKATAQGQATPIIALTASTLEEEQVITISAGCNDFMRKPFREAEIFDMMNKHIGVRYIYQDTADPMPSKSQEALTPAALAALPNDLIDDLEQACTRADMIRIDDIIEEVGTHDAATANGLALLADDFEYGEILLLIREGKKR